MARYGDGLIGSVGSAACSGLTSAKSAPSAVPLHAARSARSRRSPCPQEPRERTEYSCTANPHDRRRGNGVTALVSPQPKAMHLSLNTQKDPAHHGSVALKD